MRAAATGTDLTPEQQSVADAGLKALIPVAGGKTLLEFMVENLRSAGFSDICLVIGPEHDAIRDFCAEKDLDVSFAIQNEPKGTADAVIAAEEFIDRDELFLVVNSDNHYPVDSLRRLREVNRPAMLAFDRESLIEKSNIAEDRIAKFATVEVGDDGMMKRIIEKPAIVDPSHFVSMNAWLFPPEIFAACRAIGPSERGEFEIPTAVQYAINELGIEFAAVKTREGILDLSSRTDIATAASKLISESN